MTMFKTTAAIVVALQVVGCGSSPRDVARFQGTGVEAFAVSIVAVDGAPTTAAGASTMEPGMRKVTVAMPAAAGFKAGEQRTIDLDVKACTKYWLVATRDARVSQQYEIKVDHEQRVYTCTTRSAS